MKEKIEIIVAGETFIIILLICLIFLFELVAKYIATFLEIEIEYNRIAVFVLAYLSVQLVRFVVWAIETTRKK